MPSVAGDVGGSGGMAGCTGGGASALVVHFAGRGMSGEGCGASLADRDLASRPGARRGDGQARTIVMRALVFKVWEDKFSEVGGPEHQRPVFACLEFHPPSSPFALMTVTLAEASADQEPILQNLMQFYTHDFAEFWVGTSRGDLAADGRFNPYPMTDYWSRPGWSAQLIWRDGRLAGFALINDQPHSGAPVASSVAEFFILRKHRGGGVGREAAQMVFAQRPGSWEVAVARQNVRALAFWRRTILGTDRASEVAEIDANDERWNGPILRFIWSGGGPIVPAGAKR